MCLAVLLVRSVVLAIMHGVLIYRLMIPLTRTNKIGHVPFIVAMEVSE